MTTDITVTSPLPGPAVPAQARSAPEAMAWSRALVEPALRAAVDTLPQSMRRMAGYHFGWWEADGGPADPEAKGGKAIRPALALLSAQIVGGGPAEALPAAVAVELVHNFSLIQDDVIDADLTRRHRPTVWSVFGEGQAIVAGDALLSLASQRLLAGTPTATGQEAAQMLHAVVLELLEGQHADLAFEARSDVDLTECLAMAEGKSGALMGGACALGGLLGGATPVQVARLHRFGTQTGLAFQLADDLLGIWGDPAVTGKPVYSDLHRRKKTVPVVAALNSGTTAGAELADLYHRDRPLSDADLARAAELTDRAGGRAWSRQRAGELLASALLQLSAVAGASSSAEPASRAAAELAEVARLAAHRDR